MQQSPRLVIAGKLQVIGEISRFCRAVYHRSFGPEKGERLFRQLRFEDAVKLWREGLPHSRLPHRSTTIH